MKIVILAGGTGSIALQNGLHDIIRGRAEETEIKVIVNAYDNGLSTGAVRRVLGGNILGPSDVRKNQTTRYTFQGRADAKLAQFLDHRFTAPSDDAQRYALSTLESAALTREHNEILGNAIKAYFAAPLAKKIDYTDFSVANIVYAGLAVQNGNSLRAAAKIMADVLQIPDDVILNDDTSLFLGAITKGGVRIADEGDIVSWNNPDDPIVDVFFTNAQGDEARPKLCDEAKRAMLDADVIILSSGTQWSSLIPTYASEGFAETILKFKGKILMVMNRVPDKDAPNQGADDLINAIVPKYFPKGSIDLIIDETGHELMKHVKVETSRDLLKSVNFFNLETFPPSRHDPGKLGVAVVRTIFRDYLNSTAIMFDYDDTLVGRGNTFPNASKYNREAIRELNEKDQASIAICTGNSIKAVNFDRQAPYPEYKKPITIFADGGVNKYEYNVNARVRDEEARAHTLVECLTPEAKFTEKGSRIAQAIISTLRLAGIPTAKVENRGDVMMTIKPIDPEYRDIIRNLAAHVLQPTGLRVKTAGRTTVEIADANVTKEPAVFHVLDQVGSDGSVVFVGDEFDYGNDREVALIAAQDKRVKCLRVKNPSDTALFLSALINKPNEFL